ncbi:MAG: sulfite exporter TauE/SafE family protein [Acidimicrobiales bacterium]
MDPGPLRDALTVALGVATGAMSGLFGVGGAVISTPGIRALGASAQTAVGTTLPSIIPGAASGTLRYAREGLVDGPAVRATAPIGMVAAVAGALLTEVIPGEGHALMLTTAALVALSGARMVRIADADGPTPSVFSAGTAASAADPAEKSVARVPGDIVVAVGDRTHGRPTTMRLAAVGTLAGLLSGLLGIGGGAVMVPAFTQIAGFPLKRAIATSLACVGILAVPGTITHALLGNIDWRFALLLTVGMIPGARLGAALTIRAEDRRLRLVVGAFLGATAIAYAAGEIAALRS